MYIARGQLVSFCIDEDTENKLREMASGSPDPVAASLAKVILGSIVEDDVEDEDYASME
jgi:hypothetical protein